MKQNDEDATHGVCFAPSRPVGLELSRLRMSECGQTVRGHACLKTLITYARSGRPRQDPRLMRGLWEMAWSVSAQRLPPQTGQFSGIAHRSGGKLTAFSAYADDLIAKWRHHELRIEEAPCIKTLHTLLAASAFTLFASSALAANPPKDAAPVEKVEASPQEPANISADAWAKMIEFLCFCEP
jgi:hypothetical protein